LVDGIPIEVYFSPTDGTNAKLQHAIGSANVDMYFGVYSFTVAADADSIVDRIEAGVYVAGILDPTSSSYPPYAILSPVMGSNLIKDNITGLYHNKMLIVDPAAVNSDPQVLTGSHNWSASADTKNDENTLIIHDATLANVYYQSFYQNFKDEGGTLVVQTGIGADLKHTSIRVYPNPCSSFVVVERTNYPGMNEEIITLTDATGRELKRIQADIQNSCTIDTQGLPSGLYLIRIQHAMGVLVKKLQVIAN
jgi:phosphatidylserine/phosphatidylglycerophosphate/cardiolipin synthase-like enzyme